MDNEAINKIKILTTGDFAKEYFTKNGLDTRDVNEINEILINKINNSELDADNIEKELQLNINKRRYEKNIIERNQKLSKKTGEKKLIFKINNDYKGFKCSKCNHPLIKEFNFCPKCGSENQIHQLKLVSPSSIDLNKGFVTPDELNYIKFVTPEEIDLLNKGEKTLNEVGIQVTKKNCPFEIRNELLYKNKNLKDNRDIRKKIFEEQVAFYNSQENNFRLSSFNKRMISTDKRFPISSKLNQEDISKTILERDFLSTKKTVKKQATNKSVDLNLEYASVLYLLEVIKHPKSPKLSENTLSSLNISSNKKVINFLRKNEYLTYAEGFELIQLNLQEKTVKDLRKILSKNRLPVSGNKNELITRISENMSQEELTKYFKAKMLKVTPKGEEFIDKHPQVETYLKYLKDYPISQFDNFYRDNKNLESTELTISYLNHLRKEFVEQLQWSKFSRTYQTENRIYRDLKDLENEFETCINYFICSLNPWIDNGISLQYSKPITQNMQKEIIKLNTELKLKESTIHETFIKKVEEIQLPELFLKQEYMYNIFIRLSRKENLDKINKELASKFDTSLLNAKNLKFKTKKEQKEKFDKVKEFFR